MGGFVTYDAKCRNTRGCYGLLVLKLSSWLPCTCRQRSALGSPPDPALLVKNQFK